MRLLVLGGTRFVGLHVVRAALAASHQVDVFHRGHSAAPDGARSLRGDRDGDLSALESGRWDAVVDVSAYVPRQVRDAIARLNGRAGRYLFVSTAAVYRDAVPETAEDAPLLEPPAPDVEEVTGATYGGLKVACERAAEATFDGPVLHVRPTYVVGPDDYTDRFASWLRRVRRGGRVAAVGDPETPLAFVDVRDLGSFVVGLCTSDAIGAVNASGPARPTTWGEALAGRRRRLGQRRPPGVAGSRLGHRPRRARRVPHGIAVRLPRGGAVRAGARPRPGARPPRRRRFGARDAGVARRLGHRDRRPRRRRRGGAARGLERGLRRQ